MTAEFLDLEREIDSFALQWKDVPSPSGLVVIRQGKQGDLGDQLGSIEAKAIQLRDKAVAGMESADAVIGAPGPFATAEAEALIGAPAPTEPKRRSWWRRT